jgi:transcription initiation factor TFIIIB Brf1 subunit/transcription initiation factor TFIIB
MSVDHCPICKSTAQFQQYENQVWNCPQCGKYSITIFALSYGIIEDKTAYLISHKIRRDNDYSNIVKVNIDYIKNALNSPEQSLSQKVDNLLLAFSKDLPSYDRNIAISDPKYVAYSCSKHIKEYEYILNYVLEDTNYLTGKHLQEHILSFEGWKKIESLQHHNNFQQAFVAMWFSPSMRPIYDDAIHPAIRETKFSPFRVDDDEHIGKVDDKIIAEIQRSCFVVADFTGHRGGVYFEAGYALGRGIPVIWTCKKSDMANLHFDIRQYNTIDWENEEDLKKRLYQRIRATIGEINKSALNP